MYINKLVPCNPTHTLSSARNGKQLDVSGRRSKSCARERRLLTDAVHDDQESHDQLSIHVWLNDEAENIITQSYRLVHLLANDSSYFLTIPVHDLAVSSPEAAFSSEIGHRRSAVWSVHEHLGLITTLKD